MKFFFFYKNSRYSFSLKRLFQELQKKNIDFQIVGDEYKFNEEDLDTKNIILLRSLPTKEDLSNQEINRLFFDHKTIIINHNFLKVPEIKSKYYQQSFLELQQNLHKNAIKTYTAKNQKTLDNLIQTGDLSFPIIAKPDRGKLGTGVKLVQKKEDAKQIRGYNSLIFQKYIPNDRDYRVLVFRDKVFNIIQRIRRSGIVNNYSKGAEVRVLEKSELYSRLADLAVRINNIFGLDYSGIDFVISKDDESIYFLEINLSPQIKGFEEATKLNTAKEIIECLLNV